jgi:hypothetical protein
VTPQLGELSDTRHYNIAQRGYFGVGFRRFYAGGLK